MNVKKIVGTTVAALTLIAVGGALGSNPSDTSTPTTVTTTDNPTHLPHLDATELVDAMGTDWISTFCDAVLTASNIATPQEMYDAFVEGYENGYGSDVDDTHTRAIWIEALTRCDV